MIFFASTLIILSRCQLWEKELEIKEMKEQMKELIGLLRQSEIRRKEVEKDLKQAVSIALASPASVGSYSLVFASVPKSYIMCFRSYFRRSMQGF